MPQEVRFRGMKFQNCSDCHLDPHHGAFKQKRCEDCHTTEGWKKVLPEFSFDHSKTKYPLLGAHMKVSCVACHAKGEFQRPLKFSNCTDCHKDIHNGQFAGRPKKGECAECHKVEGGKTSLFGVTEPARVVTRTRITGSSAIGRNAAGRMGPSSAAKPATTRDHGLRWRDSTTRKPNSPCLACIEPLLAMIVINLLWARRKSCSKARR